mmetsp:Transcript_48022/g.134011  ORF Transcript_48022/g.134011 Transcript_48022/m.134011 type:complete len:200 (-) Transcript_48022:112-711(-)
MESTGHGLPSPLKTSLEPGSDIQQRCSMAPSASGGAASSPSSNEKVTAPLCWPAFGTLFVMDGMPPTNISSSSLGSSLSSACAPSWASSSRCSEPHAPCSCEALLAAQQLLTSFPPTTKSVLIVSEGGIVSEVVFATSSICLWRSCMRFTQTSAQAAAALCNASSIATIISSWTPVVIRCNTGSSLSERAPRWARSDAA